ncbi:MAG: thiolase family protein [Thermoleophilia bacterium]|nr:thiolase family protein [Thermoleophilia bacterium]
MNWNGDDVAIVGGVRTAIGRYAGSLKDIDAYALAAICIQESVRRVGLDVEEVEEVVLGQVGQVGPDAYNARRAALAAGIPASSTAMNVNRLCSSGLQAIVTAAQEVATGDVKIAVAGGNESLSRQPFFDYHARDGWRIGSRELIDGTQSILTDPWGHYVMGVTAEKVAERYEVSRETQDAFALESQLRAARAIEANYFEEEIVPVQVPGSDELFRRDEHPRPDVTAEKLAKLKPAFMDGGSVTAGNSSGINDGAATMVLMHASEAKRRRIEPRLFLRSWAVSGIEPDLMGYAPAFAIPKAVERAGLTLDDIDLIELNEAFAAQAVAVIRDVGIDPARVNVFGGAIALGHPVGGTGAILTVRLLHALERLGKKRGIVTMCIGGGQGMAAVFERP